MYFFPHIPKRNYKNNKQHTECTKRNSNFVHIANRLLHNM